MSTRLSSRKAWVFLLFGVCAASVLAWLWLDVDHGLRAEYFDRLDRAASPLLVTTDADVSANQLRASWLDSPPRAFKMHWTGYLMVPRTGRYTFALRSDAESSLAIDGHVVVDLGVGGGTGTVSLAAGARAVEINYFHKADASDLALTWAPEGETLVPVGSWSLSPLRVHPWQLTAARSLEWLALLAAAVATTFAWRGIAGGVAGGIRRFPRTACLVLFVALTVAETWPLALHPARFSRNDTSDTVLNEWAIAWVAHQAPRSPLHLFDANIFYPDRNTLAYSESMIVQSAIAAPLLWSGASPVLAYNIVLMSGFMLTGWAMCLLIHHWTGNWVAGIVSGILMAFNAHVFTRMPHLQVQHGEFLPAALLALDALLRHPTIGRSVRLGVFVTLQALTSVYFLTFAAVAMTAAAVVRPEMWWGWRRFTKLALHAMLAAVISAALLLPFLLPYWHVHQTEGAVTGAVSDATASVATLAFYLSTPSRIDYALFANRWFSGTALFPGVIGLVLATIALAGGVAFRDPRARMCLAIGLAGLTLSFGKLVPGFNTLHRVIPLFQIVRDVPRYGYLLIFGVAALAGFGVVSVNRWLVRYQIRWVVLALPALAAIEAAVAPLHFTRFEGVPAIYSSLRGVDHAVVAEVPMFTYTATFRNAPYMLNSTEHWQPLVTGYSGFEPSGYRRKAPAYLAFPAANAIAAFQETGVTHVFVHTDYYGTAIVDQLARVPALHLIQSSGEILLYRLDPSP